MTHDGYMQAAPKTIWHRLGFGTCCARFVDDEKEDFAPGGLTTDTTVDFDWRDRLRILLTGTVMVSTRTRTNVAVAKAESVCAVSVLPPAAPPPIFIRWHSDACRLVGPFSFQRDPVSVVILGLEVSFPRWRVR